MTNIRSRSPIVLMLTAALMSVSSAAHAQTTLRLLSGWAANNPFVTLVEAVFIKNVEAASNGQLKIERRGPEVASPFEQLQPVSAGVFDILYTTGAYHQGQTGVGNIFDTFKPDIEAWKAAGLLQQADEYYRKRYGLSILALSPIPGTHFVLREGLAPDGTLKGMKIRANAAFEGMVRTLGGAPVNMSPAECVFGDAEGRRGRGHGSRLRLRRLQALRGRQGHDAAYVRVGQCAVHDQCAKARFAVAGAEKNLAG